jgi:disulfide bond formation protein DsbB
LAPALLLGACAFAFAVALTTQYGFGLAPCVLCLYQRIPYGVAAGLSLAALWPKTPPKARMALVALCAVAFLVDAGIAAYHVGVEQHWWESACVGGINPEAASVENLQALLAGPPPVPCDRVPWAVFGISMAGYNGLFALCLAAFSAWAARRMKEDA